jgi:hypothetical protein
MKWFSLAMSADAKSRFFAFYNIIYKLFSAPCKNTILLCFNCLTIEVQKNHHRRKTKCSGLSTALD